tara:strand:- start:328 stop:1491 length:1164 start_codon:yes stop_codon:yes gene_type:complete
LKKRGEFSPLFLLLFIFVTMKNLKSFTLLFTIISLTLIGCSSSDDDSSGSGSGGGGNQQNTPSNLVATVTIQGQDTANPYGDGSGNFSCTATATNAVKYGFKVGNGTESQNTTGVFSHTINTSGTNQFALTIYAYSNTDERISTIKNLTIEVYGNTNGGSGNNDVLVWSDEFDGNGSINTEFWNFETGGGGWGNQEVQIYTSNTNNVVKENGILKIRAVKESNGTYSSARITTQNKIDFKYARIDIRAKLPSVAGTWPALWMLGSSFSSEGWPYCGEIDIMEQFEDKSYVQTTCHWNNNGTTASYGLPRNLSTPTEFHVYSLDWRAGTIIALIDDVETYAFSTNSTMPFDANFFLIFNLAMGGSNGGTIDPNFTTDAMEVDYIRVYQ